MPAIEETTKTDFNEALKKVLRLAIRVHVDFNDGSFQGFKTVLPQEFDALPENINFEAHLMVAKPFEYIPKLKELGFRKFIIQWEISGNIRDIVEQLMEEDVLVGVAIAPETPVADLEPVLEMLDCVAIMTVVPGKQGQDFLPENLKKIQELRNGGFFGEIEADGGINEENIKSVISFRPDTLVVGSFIVNAESPVHAYERLVQVVIDNSAICGTIAI